MISVGKRMENRSGSLCGSSLCSLVDRAEELETVLVGRVVQCHSDTEASNRIVNEKKWSFQGNDAIEDGPRNSAAVSNVNLPITGVEDGVRNGGPIMKTSSTRTVRGDGAEPAVTVRNESVPRALQIESPRFEFLRVLGQGGFATVILVRKKGGPDDGTLYAMKVMDKAWIIEHGVVKDIMTERLILETIRDYPSVTKLHYAFQTDSKLCLVLDYMSGGSLAHASHGRNLNEREVRIYIGEIILALERLHNANIIHRDISLDNVLLDSQGHVVISDFGVSRMFFENERHRAYSWCGTVLYMAPEVHADSDDGYDMTVDWWSVGILTCQLLAGLSPFKCENESLSEDELITRVTEDEPYIPDNLSPDAADFISKLLVKDPKQRLGGGEDGVEELKRHPFFKGINWCSLAQRKYVAPFVPNDGNELDDIEVSDEFSLMNLADLPRNLKKTFRGYSYGLSVVPCSDEIFEVTAENCTNPADHLCYQYIRTIEYLRKKLNDAKQELMRADIKNLRLESSLKDAEETIEYLEEELDKAECENEDTACEKKDAEEELEGCQKENHVPGSVIE
jgi:serine/threonine protein kinase